MENKSQQPSTEMAEIKPDHWASKTNYTITTGDRDKGIKTAEDEDEPEASESSDKEDSKMDNLAKPKAKLISNEVVPEDATEAIGHLSDSNAVRSLTAAGENQKRATLSWQGVDVFAPMDQGSICRRLCRKPEKNEPKIKQILFDVNGKVEPGTLLAVMGASGAGKTTLMNVLAHRNIGSVTVMGSVMVNNIPVGLNINSISAYVQQEDLFIGTLTVREHLTFQALLRMDRCVSKKDRLNKVEEVLQELGLVKCADTLIGVPGRLRGISGGEKKRLSFASEVLTDPSILFADEPTSGLDSFMAQNVVSTLQRLASQGRTIVCTIHQPSSEVYAMFSSVLLMAEGRVAYLGPLHQAVPYFANLGHMCPSNFNPADFFVQLLAIVPGQEEECRERTKKICDFHAEQEKMERENGSNRSKSFSEDDVVTHQPYKASWFTQFRAVLWRSWISTQRDKMMSRIRLIQSIVTGLIAGLIYLQTPINTSGVQNLSGAIFFLVTSVSFSGLQGVIFVFPAELPVFLRDHKNGMYRTDVYFLSKTLAELPIFILSPLLLTSVAYWMIGLRPEFLPFIYCFAFLAALTNVAISYGYVISSLSPTVEGASALGPPLMLPLMLFGGFFLKDSTVPLYFIWIKYISWFRYGFELLIVNQWDGYGVIDNCGFNQTASETLCIPNGQAAIKFLGLRTDTFMIDIYALLALFAGFRIIAFLLLLRRSSKTQ